MAKQKTLNADALNNLHTEYFDIMQISREQKLERIELAMLLTDVFIYVFTYYEAEIKTGNTDADLLAEVGKRRFEDTVREYGINLDNYPMVAKHIDEVSKEMAKSTVRQSKSDKPNKTSSSANTDIDIDIQERAINVAQNESNSIFNRVEYDDAVSSGKYTEKIWYTEADSKVRDTHRDVDLVTVPIDEYFDVGGSKMLFPRDTSSDDIDPKEIVNCRCSVVYK